MKINNIPRFFYYSLVLAFMFTACAKIVAPTGGPKDEQHPLIVEIDPPDYSVNFEEKRLK